MSAPASQSVSLPGGFAPNTTLVRGEGSPVVFLHGPFGQEWSGFLMMWPPGTPSLLRRIRALSSPTIYTSSITCGT